MLALTVISVVLAAISVGIGATSIRLLQENRELRKQLDLLKKHPCFRIKLFLSAPPSDPIEATQRIEEFRKEIMDEEQRRLVELENGVADVPLCLWGEVVLGLCESSNLNPEVRSRLDREGTLAATRLLKSVLSLLVKRKVAVPSRALDLLSMYIPTQTDEDVLSTAEISGLLSVAFHGSKGGYPQKSVELFLRTVHVLSEFHTPDAKTFSTWENIVRDLLVQRMPALCTDGESLRTLLSVVWAEFVDSRDFSVAVSHIWDAVSHTPAYECLCELSDENRNALAGMVEARIDYTVRRLTDNRAGSEESRHRLQKEITACKKLKRGIRNPFEALAASKTIRA